VKAETRFIPPTIIENPRLDSRLMTEEIFGPILPIVTMRNIDEGIKLI
jgi:aldehyde dehydrogenase (NAD+)